MKRLQFVSSVMFFLGMAFISCDRKQDSETGARESPISSTAPRESIKDTMDAIIENLVSSSEVLNIDKALSRFLPSSDFSFISNGQVVTLEKLKELEGAYFKTLKSQDYQFTHRRSELITDKYAITELSGTVITEPVSGPARKFQIAETLIFKKINGTWYIAGGHESYYELPAGNSATADK